MNAIEIQDIWRVIRESERSDESYFTRNKTSTQVEALHAPQQLQAVFSDMGSEPGRMSVADTLMSPPHSELG